jgi:Right handed beta helix region
MSFDPRSTSVGIEGVGHGVRRTCLGTLLVALIAGLWAQVPVTTQSSTTCPAANPYDAEPDNVAIQDCLARFDRVLLEPAGRPGYLGYLIADTVRLRRDGVLLTSSKAPAKVFLIAAPALAVPIFRSEANGFEISFIRFDGNRDARDVRIRPCSVVRNYRNVELSGVAFKVRYSESTRAVCASGMTIGASSRFEVANSWFYENGRQPEDADDVSGLWADGLNVFNTTGATIRDNTFWDNTDVDLVIHGGPGCAVYRNTIEHFDRYGFAGMQVGFPDRSGCEISENRVSSARDRLGFGIVVGCHPWAQCEGGYATDLWVHDNVIRGAVVNLAVDGLNGGTVERNVIAGAQGSRVMNCLESADYIVAHVINARLQSGFRVRVADFGAPCP